MSDVEDGRFTRFRQGVLAFGVINGLLSGGQFALGSPEQRGIATEVYYYAGRALLEGRDIYAVTPPDMPGFHFLYPPIVALATLPYAFLGDPLWGYAIQTLLNLFAAAALAILSVRTIAAAGREVPRRDQVLVASYALAAFTVTSTIVMAQINLLLAVAVTIGALVLDPNLRTALPERVRTTGFSPGTVAGALFGAAALVKLFPTLFGAWLLRRREWRAIAAAIATGGIGLVLGTVLLGPELTVQYFTTTIPREAAVGSFADGPAPGSPYMTVRRQLALVAPGLNGHVQFAASVLVVGPVVLACYRTVGDPVARLVALEATILGTLILFPLEPFYLTLAIFPVIPLAFLLEVRVGRWLHLGGILLISAPLRLPGLQGWIEIAPVGPALEATLHELAVGLFTVAMPSMIGVWLLFTAAILEQHRRA